MMPYFVGNTILNYMYINWIRVIKHFSHLTNLPIRDTEESNLLNMICNQTVQPYTWYPLILYLSFLLYCEACKAIPIMLSYISSKLLIMLNCIILGLSLDSLTIHDLNLQHLSRKRKNVWLFYVHTCNK